MCEFWLLNKGSGFLMCESLGVIAKFLYNRNLPFEQGIWIVKLESI